MGSGVREAVGVGAWPDGGDEINIIEQGHNYGWGVASKGHQGGITKTSEPGMDDPVVYYTPALGPRRISFYTGNRYPAGRTPACSSEAWSASG